MGSDAFLPVDCDQELVVDRTWTVTDCDSVYMHVQRLELRDNEAPRVVNPDVSGHYFSNTMDWLPVLQDNCDAALEGDIQLSDTMMLCCGVMSFHINLSIPDDCGNVLDTVYTVYMHDLEPYLACEEPVEPSSLCGEGTVFDEGVGRAFGQDAFPIPRHAAPTPHGMKAWPLCPCDVDARVLFRQQLGRQCGHADLLTFLGAYGQSCGEEED